MFGRIARRLGRPEVYVLVFCLLLVTLNIVLVQHSYNYNSDDVSWQSILTTWRPFSGQRAYLGSKDNFLVNLPFILIVNLFTQSGRMQLLLTSLLMALVNFILFYFACLYFLKKFKIRTRSYGSLMPFIWVASLGVGLYGFFLNTVWRDYEVGFIFVYYALAAMYYFGEIHPLKNTRNKILSLLMLLFVGAYVLSDLYFFYFAVIPVLVLFIVQYARKIVPAKKLLFISLWSLFAVGIARASTSVLARIGIFIPGGGLPLTKLSKLGSSVVQMLKSSSYIFGITTNGFKWTSIADLFIVLLSIVILFSILRPREKAKISVNNVTAWKIFFGVVALCVLIAYVAVDDGGSSATRYLFLTIYLAALILSLYSSALTKIPRQAVVLLIALAILSNLAASFNSFRLAADSIAVPNAANTQLITTIRGLGLSKGYAGYWDGNINSYMAGNINFLPVTCVKGRTKPLDLLVNAGLFKEPSSRTFLILSPGMNPPLCSRSQVVSQFGRPAQTIRFSSKTIMVYNYDIYSRMN